MSEFEYRRVGTVTAGSRVMTREGWAEVADVRPNGLEEVTITWDNGRDETIKRTTIVVTPGREDRITTVQLSNIYADGHFSARRVELPTPADDQDVDEWFENDVRLETGDGHGGPAAYSADVIASDRSELVGRTAEWI